MKNNLKNTLLTVLNQCIYNKSIADYTAIMEFISSVKDEDIKDINIKHNKISIYVSMFNSDYKLISISFTDSNKLLFSLPDNISKTHIIENCGYNIQYDDIKSLLSISN